MITPRTTLIRPRATLVLCLVAVTLLGCQATPNADFDAARQASDATGLTVPLRFIAVGPDGGPLDEPDDPGSSLTLSRAIERAVTSDPRLQAALARVRVAMADADQARLLPNPVLNVVLRWGPGKPQIEASLAQDFVQALQIPRRSAAADNRLRQTAADVVTVALDVASETHERYATIQSFTRLITLLRERRTIIEQLIGAAQSRLDAGEGTRADLATLRAQLVELDVDIDQALLLEREDRVRLARLIGTPSSSATWSLDSWSAPSTELAPESRWIDLALAHRPEVQSITWKLRALSDDEAIARLLPWEGASAGVDAQRDDKLFAGPSISTPIPVLDTGQARRQRVTSEQLEARHELTQARRKVVEEVRLAHHALSASNANIHRIRTELLPLQRSRRELAESSYRAGQTDVTAVYLAEHDLRVAQAKAIEAERHASAAMIRLQRAAGGAGVVSSLVGAAPASKSSASPTQPAP